jgi:hypothetical protein
VKCKKRSKALKEISYKEIKRNYIERRSSVILDRSAQTLRINLIDRAGAIGTARGSEQHLVHRNWLVRYYLVPKQAHSFKRQPLTSQPEIRKKEAKATYLPNSTTSPAKHYVPTPATPTTTCCNQATSAPPTRTGRGAATDRIWDSLQQKKAQISNHNGALVLRYLSPSD